MFKRRKNEEEHPELDAAWEDEAPTPAYAAASDLESGDGNYGEAAFPEPHEFDMSDEEIPLSDDDREAEGDVVFDADDSFAYDAESEEFTTGDAVGFTDDSHADFYVYGEEMHGVHDAPDNAENAGVETSAAVVGRHGRHGSGLTTKQQKLAEMPEHQRRSRRMRRILIVVVLLLLALLGGLGYLGYQLFQESRSVAEQEVTETTTEVAETAETETVSQDASTDNEKKTTVPNLLDLIGLSQEDAIAKLGSGATVTLDSEVSEQDNPMVHRLTVVLTEEPSDTKSGAPTVYLGLDHNEQVVTAGYSAATASLGYGTLSFADAVTSEHVVERTLSEGGLAVADGSVSLPEREEYSTYTEDGSTLVKEQWAFDGQESIDGADYDWTGVLVYNYTASNATGNLADTVRQIYVYVTDVEAGQASVAEKERLAKEKAEKEEAEARAAEEEARRAAEEEAARANAGN